MTWQLCAFLALYLFAEGFGYILELLNLRHLRLHGHAIPPEFAGRIDSDQLESARRYTLESSRYGLISSVFDEILMLVFIFSGLLVWYSKWIDSLGWNFVVSGLLFFLVLSVVKTGLDLPWELYEDFVIERKYGFNRKTPWIWFTDLLKSTGMSLVFTAVLSSGAFALILWLPHYWWVAVWGFFFAFTIFMMYLSPYVLEPLFNKFTPIDDAALVDGIRDVLEKGGIKVKGVFKMDASRRTSHTNAYFTGIGREKRIVLYDTLLEKLDRDEIIAVLAHEAGHCRHRHIIKLMVVFELTGLVAFYVAFLILESGWLEWLFGMSGLSFPARVVLLSFAAGVITWLGGPLFNMLSRYYERQADAFARGIVGSGDALAGALIKLSTDNLSNLYPHPLYAFFYYSHPPVLERIRGLRGQASDENRESVPDHIAADPS